MSIEFFGRPQPPLSGENIVRVIQLIKKATDLIVVRDELTSIGINYVNGANPVDYEEITVSIYSDRIYVGFHVGTGQQRDRVVRLITGAIEENNSRCELVED